MTYAFFLGGRDLEMVEIFVLLRRLQRDGDSRIGLVHDRSLPWGAKASDYRDEILYAQRAGYCCVLIELLEDMTLPQGHISIDHHGERSNQPSSLAQVFSLLQLPASMWSRRLALVDANDRGHINLMKAEGASIEHMRSIRAADRIAQGVTLAEEAAGLQAIAKMRQALDNSLLLVELTHERSATVCDPLALNGEERDLLIFCPSSTQFFGKGDRICQLDAAFPGGWRGGLLPEIGFWGVSEKLSVDEVASTLTEIETGRH